MNKKSLHIMQNYRNKNLDFYCFDEVILLAANLNNEHTDYSHDFRENESNVFS